MTDCSYNIDTWIDDNYDAIIYYLQLVNQTQARQELMQKQMQMQKQEQEQEQEQEKAPEKPKTTVRQYQPRKYPIKATEHERAVSRAYYIAHREEILEKRRLYHLRNYKKNKNLKKKKILSKA